MEPILQREKGIFHLREAIGKWNIESIGRAAEQKGIKWHFSPPSAPHFGGIWEHMVHPTKTALYAILGDQVTPGEILSTVMAEVEFILNNR